MGLVVTPVPNIKTTDENVSIAGPQRGIVLWAFSNDTELGDVKRFDVPTGYVIAKLKAVNDTGLMNVENARAQVEPILKK